MTRTTDLNELKTTKMIPLKLFKMSVLTERGLSVFRIGTTHLSFKIKKGV